MNRIIGYENEKREVGQLKKMLLNADEYERRGLHIPRGLLISGKCGVGKSVLARSLEGGGVNMTVVDFSGIDEENVSEALSKAFAQAKENAPCVLLLDELDKNAGESTYYFPRNLEGIRNVLLRELDGIMSGDHILVVATCNDEDSLGDALKRSGRFDRHLKMKLPDFETRKLIAASYLDDIDMACDVNMDEFGSITQGYSGADVECLVNEMGIVALLDESPAITMDHFRLALNRKTFGNAEGTIPDEEGKHYIAVHEAGHAIAAMYLDPGSLHGASIKPQGEVYGFVEYIPAYEKVMTVGALENEITIALAGHVAERIVLGTYTPGAGDDITMAVRLTNRLVGRFAAYGYAGALLWTEEVGNNASESQKDAFGKMVLEKIEEFDGRAAEIIEAHRDVFDNVVNALEKRLALSKEQLMEMKA